MDSSGGPTAAKFTMKNLKKAVIPMRDSPKNVLPEWGGVAEFSNSKFILHPPMNFELTYNVDQFVWVIPYSLMKIEMSINDRPFQLVDIEHGSAFFVFPNQTIRVRTMQPVEFIVCVMNRAYGIELLSGFKTEILLQDKATITLKDAGVSQLACEARRALLGDSMIKSGYLSSLLDTLFLRITSYFDEPIKAKSQNIAMSTSTLKKVTTYIDENISEPIKVESLVDVAGLSRSHFSRSFHQAMGYSPQRYILQRRLAKSRQLLTDTEDSMVTIALQCGFSNHAHFSRVFKEILGVSPSSYRSKFLQQDV